MQQDGQHCGAVWHPKFLKEQKNKVTQAVSETLQARAWHNLSRLLSHSVIYLCSFLQSHRRAPKHQKHLYITDRSHPVGLNLLVRTPLWIELCRSEWTTTIKHVSHTLEAGVSIHARAHARVAFTMYLYGGTELQTRVGLGMGATAVGTVSVWGTWEGGLSSRREMKTHIRQREGD